MIICYISQVFVNKPPISFTTLIIKSYCTFITNNIFHDILHSISRHQIGTFDLRIFTAINCSIIVKVYERMKFLCFFIKMLLDLPVHVQCIITKNTSAYQTNTLKSVNSSSKIHRHVVPAQKRRSFTLRRRTLDHVVQDKDKAGKVEEVSNVREVGESMQSLYCGAVDDDDN